ncbi:unnamed protein product [Merluccius merluccius]
MEKTSAGLWGYRLLNSASSLNNLSSTLHPNQPNQQTTNFKGTCIQVICDGDGDDDVCIDNVSLQNPLLSSDTVSQLQSADPLNPPPNMVIHKDV